MVNVMVIPMCKSVSNPKLTPLDLTFSHLNWNYQHRDVGTSLWKVILIFLLFQFVYAGLYSSITKQTLQKKILFSAQAKTTAFFLKYFRQNIFHTFLLPLIRRLKLFTAATAHYCSCRSTFVFWSNFSERGENWECATIMTSLITSLSKISARDHFDSTFRLSCNQGGYAVLALFCCTEVSIWSNDRQLHSIDLKVAYSGFLNILTLLTVI